MVFSSPIFLFVFLPLVLAVYLPVSRTRTRNWILLVVSLFFYTWGEHFFVALMLASIVGNYLFALWVARTRTTASAKWALGAAVCANLALLVAFKYSNFLVDNVNLVLHSAGLPTISFPKVHLPIGISFFTFQAMSYVIDVYRHQQEVERHPLNVGVYISMFPHLVAGPIVRYGLIAAHIAQRDVTRDDIIYGFRRFTIGLAKKVLIADTVALAADRIFALPAGELTTGVAWLAVICYTLQIYFDFSGYSDMAIGLARFLGFHFPENFNYPYISQSVREFWRRWHITLSTWFRDYVYLALGGNRCRPIRVYFNLFAVFFLCGLWHGASWTFVIWGLLHGTFLIIERLGFEGMLKRFWWPLRNAYVLLCVAVAWVFFRCDTLGHAMSVLGAMFGWAGGTGVEHNVQSYCDARVLAAIVAGVIGSTPVLPFLGKWITELRASTRIDGLRLAATRGVDLLTASSYVLILLVCMLQITAQAYSPFIYFRF